MNLLINPTKTYGVENDVINVISKNNIRIDSLFENEEMKFVRDNKLNAVYKIKSRYKNTRKKCSDSNTETLVLEFDTNLSTDFTLSHVDFQAGTSYTLSLKMSVQTDYGRTCLRVQEQHVNEQQELFEETLYFYCPTVKGTITKRLQEYKKAFDEQGQQYIQRYLDKGFRTSNTIVNNLAEWMICEFNFGYEIKERLNQYLTIYSALNGDCFHQEHTEKTSYCIYSAPYHHRPGWDYGKRSYYKKPFLFAEQQDLILKIRQFVIKNDRKIHELTFEKCIDHEWSGSRLNYSRFKTHILELWNQWEKQQ